MFRSKESKESRSQALQSPSTPEPFSGPPQDRPTQLPLVSQTSHGPASIATNSNPSPSAPIGKGQNYGIQVLHSGSGACVDIVFVHGLTGNAYDTWLHKETGIHWPSGLLGQDLPDTRIMSFGYDADVVNLWNPASKSRLSSHGENLVGDLVRERERTDTETRKILFVAHSLGGLVTEYALSHSRHAAEKHLHQIERCTAGIVFIGTYISEENISYLIANFCHIPLFHARVGGFLPCLVSESGHTPFIYAPSGRSPPSLVPNLDQTPPFHAQFRPPLPCSVPVLGPQDKVPRQTHAPAPESL